MITVPSAIPEPMFLIVVPSIIVIVLNAVDAEDRAPPTLVSVTSTSTSSITITFSEPISAQSANIENYNLLGTTIRNIGSGTEDRTVIISASTFIDATLQIPITATIEDTSGNVLQDGATQPVVKNDNNKNKQDII